MDNPIIYQVGGGLLFIIFCVMTFLVAKTWRATHLIFGFLTFLAAMGFIVMAALSNKTNAKWKKEYSQHEVALEAAKELEAKLTYGIAADESGNRPETVLSARGNLNRALLDRGRVWRDCSPGAVTGNAITLSTVPAGVDPATAEPNRIDANMVVYAFKEVEKEAGYKVPDFYLGEFKVDAATDDSVTLSATLSLLPTQVQEAAKPDRTWVLYEMMPIDGHRIFAQDPTEEVHLDVVEDQPVFGNMWTTEQLATLPMKNLPANLLEEYARDGTKPRQDDPPDNVYTKVEFLKKHTVIVDSSTAQGGLNSEYFDSQGRAAVDRLRRGEDAVFEKTNIAVFSQEAADTLIDSEVCKPIETVFVRSLLDFDVGFQNFWTRYNALQTDYAQLERNVAAITEARDRNVAQERLREQEQMKLQSDKMRFVDEQAKITAYLATLTKKRDDMRKLLGALYSSNAQMAAKLAKRQRELTIEINQRAAAATAATTP